MSEKKAVVKPAKLRLSVGEALRYQLGVFAVLAVMFCLRFFPSGEYDIGLLSNYLMSIFRGFYVNFLGGTLLDIFAGVALAATLAGALTALALMCAAAASLIGRCLYDAEKDESLALPLALFAGLALAAPASFSAFFSKASVGRLDPLVLLLILASLLCLRRERLGILGCVLAALAASAGFTAAFAYLPLFVCAALSLSKPRNKEGTETDKAYGVAAAVCFVCAILIFAGIAAATSFSAVSEKLRLTVENGSGFLFSSLVAENGASGTIFSHIGDFFRQASYVPQALLVCLVIDLPLLVLLPIFWMRAIRVCRKHREPPVIFILPLLSPLFALPSLVRFVDTAQFFTELILAQVLAVFFLFLNGSETVRDCLREMRIFRKESLVFSLLCIVYMLLFFSRVISFLPERGRSFFDAIPF